jgi:hypothetical protein
MMGAQGIVASICPIDVTDNAAGNDPNYGYRPAVNAIVERLKPNLANVCLPNKIGVTADGSVPCSILVTLPGAGSCTNPTCPAGLGLSVPPKALLASFCASEEQDYAGEKGAPGDPTLASVCELTQLTASADPLDFDANGSCAASVDKGWCYVEGAGAEGCAQTILFSSAGLPAGALTNLVCSP